MRLTCQPHPHPHPNPADCTHEPCASAIQMGRPRRRHHAGHPGADIRSRGGRHHAGQPGADTRSRGGRQHLGRCGWGRWYWRGLAHGRVEWYGAGGWAVGLGGGTGLHTRLLMGPTVSHGARPRSVRRPRTPWGVGTGAGRRRLGPREPLGFGPLPPPYSLDRLLGMHTMAPYVANCKPGARPEPGQRPHTP